MMGYHTRRELGGAAVFVFKAISAKLALVIVMVGVFGTGVLLFNSARLALSLHNDLDATHDQFYGGVVTDEWRDVSLMAAKILADDLARHMARDDLLGVNEHLKTAALRNPDVRYLVVLDPSGRVLAEVSENQDKVGTIASDPLSGRGMLAADIQRQANREILDVSAPVELGSTRFATLHLRIASHRFSAKIAAFHRERDAQIKGFVWDKIYKMALLGLLSSAVFVAIALAFLRRTLATPLRAMVQASTKVRAGDLSSRVPIRSSEDELGSLATAFNATIEWLQNVLESIPDGVALWDSQSRLVVCNENYRRFNPLIGDRLVFGVSLEEMVTAAVRRGQYVIDTPPDAWIAERLRLCREGEGEQEYVLADGRSLLVRHRLTPEGGVASTTVDITELKRAYLMVAESKFSLAVKTLESKELELARSEAERAREELRLLLDSTGEGFYGLDFEGRCTFINRACLKMFGYDSPEELLGRNLHGLIHHTHADGSAYPLDECRIQSARKIGVGVTVADEIFWRRDGSSFPIEYTAFPVRREGGGAGAVVCVTDITERMEASEALRRHALDNGTIAEIMKLSLSDAPLEQILEQALKLVLTNHGLGLLAQGSVFLREGEATLMMVVQSGMPDYLLTACATVPFGHCLCGRAAATGTVVYADCVDHRHETRFPEMAPHGHYCVPINDDGKVLGVLNLYVPAHHGGGENELRFVGIVADTLASVIRHYRAKEAVRRGEGHLRSLVDNAGDCILVYNFDGKIISANRRACADLGYASEELTGMDLVDIDADLDADGYIDRWSAMRPGEPLVTESHFRRKDGQTFPVEIHLGYYETGKSPLIVMLAHDITERRAAEELVKRMASHDSLTGLPNRALFHDRLSMALSVVRRSGNQLALLFLDLDGFKAVNDAMGHAAGDSLLKQVSARLLSCVREMDTVARLGGDEFTIILPDITAPIGSVRVAENALTALGQSFSIDGVEVSIGVSIGIAHYPGEGETSEKLLAAADRAMYAAKNSGKNQYVVATADC